MRRYWREEAQLLHHLVLLLVSLCQLLHQTVPVPQPDAKPSPKDFVSRLYFCDMENSPERDGLRMLKKAGVQITVMSYKDFFYCWQTFVDRKQSNFKPWEELHPNSVRLARKLNRILQPFETEDLRDAFKLLGL